MNIQTKFNIDDRVLLMGDTESRWINQIKIEVYMHPESGHEETVTQYFVSDPLGNGRFVYERELFTVPAEMLAAEHERIMADPFMPF